MNYFHRIRPCFHLFEGFFFKNWTFGGSRRFNWWLVTFRKIYEHIGWFFADFGPFFVSSRRFWSLARMYLISTCEIHLKIIFPKWMRIPQIRTHCTNFVSENGKFIILLSNFFVDILSSTKCIFNQNHNFYRHMNWVLSEPMCPVCSKFHQK